LTYLISLQINDIDEFDYISFKMWHLWKFIILWH
jgi:hypothetical protein